MTNPDGHQFRHRRVVLRRRRLGVGGALVAAATATLIFGVTSADAATSSEVFCRTGASAGQCSAPSDVAVDQSGGPGGPQGTVYVVDKGNSRVDVFDTAGRFLMAFGVGVADGAQELQTCVAICGQGPEREGLRPESIAVDQVSHDVYVGLAGSVEKLAFDALTGQFEFLLSFGNGVLDGGATGTGDVSAGSDTVTNVITKSRRFEVGQTVIGSGIPAGARIVELPNNDSIVLSQSATASGSGISLIAPTPPANKPVNEIQSIALAGSPTGGVFGLAVFAPGLGETGNQVGQSTSIIGDSITATTTSGSTSATAVSRIQGRGNVTAGSTSVTGTKLSRDPTKGQSINGTGIPAGTVIVEARDASLTISQAATLSANNVGLSFTAHGTGDLTAGSNEINDLTSQNEFLARQTIEGPGIPVDTTILECSPSPCGFSGVKSLTLSKSVTVSGSSVALTATEKPLLKVGEAVSGPGVPVGDTIAAIAANGDLTLSQAATASTVGVSLDAGVPFDASAAALQSLLETSLGVGSVAVNGPSGGPWTVEFKGSYADTNLAAMYGYGEGLTPSEPVNVEVAVQGAGAAEVCTAVEVSEGYLCDPGMKETQGGAGQLPRGRAPIAIDPTTRDVWVGSTERLEAFGETGEYLSEVKLAGAGTVAALAANSAGEFFVRSGTIEGNHIANNIPGVRKYDGSGNLVASWGQNGVVDASGYVAALALDSASDDLYVGGCPAATGEQCPGFTLLRFNSSGKQTEAFGFGEVIGEPYGNALAFGDAVKRLYAVSNDDQAASAGQSFAAPPPGPLVGGGSASASAVRKTTATLSESIDPEGAPTTYRFQYITEAQFEKNEAEGREGFAGAQETPVSSSIGEDFAFHSVSLALSGLATDTAYRFRAVAMNGNGTAYGEVSTFETLPPASVDASVSHVTATSATLTADVNPLGDATSYRFQYIAREAVKRNEQAGESPFTGAAYAPSVEVPIGSGEQPVTVFQHVQGLVPGTVYLYRVLAVNVAAPQGFGSQALSFTTQPASAGPVLADSRQWELVSPPDKGGSRLLPIELQGLVQAAGFGNAISYLASRPTEPEPDGYAEAVQVMSIRGPSGWSSRNLVAPHTSATGVPIGEGVEYRFFSTDLSVGLLQPLGAFEPSLSAEASEQTPYIRTDFSGQSDAFCSEACYRPVLTAEDVTSGVRFGGCPASGSGEFCGAIFVGASPDLKYIVIHSKVGLTSMPGDTGGLYEYGDGTVRLVSVLPGSEPANGGSLGYFGLASDARGAVSKDGSRVFWSGQAGGQTHLYMRDNATQSQSAVNGSAECTEPEQACTIQIDTVHGGPGVGRVNPIFQFASEDGSRIFFTDTQALTASSGAQLGAPDLYECHIEVVAGNVRCSLMDLTPRTGGESADVQGTVPGISADGSYVYAIGYGALAAGAVAGQPNLYELHEGTVTLVATLSPEDAPDWAEDLSHLTARVSPDGRWLTFMSQRPLTGYDNRDAASGKRDEELFLYHASASGGGGRLMCASCDPTGARPVGVEYGSLPLGSPINGDGSLWTPATRLAADIPGWTTAKLLDARYQSRYLSNEGRLFFNSPDALVPSDTNGTWDVYEYEPPGGEGLPSGDTCAPSSDGYAPAAEGCLSLISSGASPEESGFLDASETGGDVFFLTYSRLSPLDADAAADVYDAHVCTAEVPCPPPPPPPAPSCLGDACQAPAVVPETLTPGSLTFAGAGDVVPTMPTSAASPKAKRPTRAEMLARALRACRRQKAKRKKVACQMRARRLYGSKAKARGSRKGARI